MPHPTISSPGTLSFPTLRARLHHSVSASAQALRTVRDGVRVRHHRKDRQQSLSLALQGGGAHGAFSWGVLDRLLDEPMFTFPALTGASAGAMNATVMAHGLLTTGPSGAQDALRQFWQAVGTKATTLGVQNAWLGPFGGTWPDFSAQNRLGMHLMTQVLSPYQFNPWDLNPLREILLDLVDFERLRLNRRVKLFVSSTNVRTGRGRVFRTGEISVESVLASAALPSLHHAVALDGEHFWDGGYSANPPILPLVEHSASTDILIVQIEPVRVEKLPVTAEEIQNRTASHIFAAPLMQELETLQRIVQASRWGLPLSLGRRARETRLHHIDGGSDLSSLPSGSRLQPDWESLSRLHDIGWQRADDWVRSNAGAVGRHATYHWHKHAA
ncbi:MAG: patatin-like phospholipase family protein [Alphaproteobacteria bacterium]|nr:patatin-like phospholipase family protein [Alphaproteobacteria bacterium]